MLTHARGALERAALLVGLCALAAFVSAAPLAEANEPADPVAAVVKVYSAAVIPDHAKPWRPGHSVSYTGSGAVVEGGRVLTNAHVVQGHTYVQVRPNGGADKYPARVAFVSHAADLALLEVESPRFHEQVDPLPLGELPAVRDEVSALGFPLGGDTLSITDGVVSRVEHETYVHSWESLLSIQMDAAIAPGSSGGPVVQDGRLVGVAMQGLSDSALGCAIPVPVVRQFLADVGDGRYDGIPDLGLHYQSLENPTLKRSLGVPPSETGVVLVRVPWSSPFSGTLEPMDVLVEIAGHHIADDGSVKLRERERTDFRYATDLLQVGDRVVARYLREGVSYELDAELLHARAEERAAPRLFDHAGDYFVYGGIAFVNLTWNFVHTQEWVPDNLREALRAPSDLERAEFVVVAGILSGEVNRGYEGSWGDIVEQVNDESPTSLEHLVQLVETSDGPYVTFALDTGWRIAIDREQAQRESSLILERYGVTADRSAGLLRGSDTHVASRAGRGPRPASGVGETRAPGPRAGGEGGGQ